jgi:hypothetical protein
VYGVRTSLVTAGTGTATTVDIKANGTSIFSGTSYTTIGATLLTSFTGTGSLAGTLTATPVSLAIDSEIKIYTPAVGTGAQGLKVTFLYTL